MADAPDAPAPPMPPLELRLTVGLSDTEPFENRSGDLVFDDDVPAGSSPRVLDFGCGCGRLARELYARAEAGEHVDFPADEAPTGLVRAPERRPAA